MHYLSQPNGHIDLVCRGLRIYIETPRGRWVTCEEDSKQKGSHGHKSLHPHGGSGGGGGAKMSRKAKVDETKLNADPSGLSKISLNAVKK